MDKIYYHFATNTNNDWISLKFSSNKFSVNGSYDSKLNYYDELPSSYILDSKTKEEAFLTIKQPDRWHFEFILDKKATIDETYVKDFLAGNIELSGRS